ncbi:Short integuments 2, mitochondrial-like protein [Drosera capensis]
MGRSATLPRKLTITKSIGSMAAKMGGDAAVNWFPGHMAVAIRAIRPTQGRRSRPRSPRFTYTVVGALTGKRRVIALNKKDLANPNILQKWNRYFEACGEDCVWINAHSKSSVRKLLDLVELKLKEVIAREPTLLVMVVGVPNVGKSALINSIHQISLSRFPAQDKTKRATVGPLPGVTQDIAGYKIAHNPSIYVLDTPGVLVPRIPDIETGSVKDSVVGEERMAQFLLAILNSRGTPLHWQNLNTRKSLELPNDTTGKHEYNLKNLSPSRRQLPDRSDVHYVENLVTEVQQALCRTFKQFDGDLEDENGMETLIVQQFEALKVALKVPHSSSEARTMVAKKFLTLFRTGKLGPFILDDACTRTDTSELLEMSRVKFDSTWRKAHSESNLAAVLGFSSTLGTDTVSTPFSIAALTSSSLAFSGSLNL